MPTYDYVCQRCGTFEAFRRAADRNALVACPVCALPAQRIYVPQLRAQLAVSGRIEDARKRGTYRRLRNVRACGCCEDHAFTESPQPKITAAAYTR
jgi:putative FmdB family regulatory protein